MCFFYTFLRKNLHNSKKSSNFAVDFGRDHAAMVESVDTKDLKSFGQ